MPYKGGRRKKTRTEPDIELSEKEKTQTPRCFVLKRGILGDRVKELLQDFRNVMLPNCAKALRESKTNRVEDFIAVAGHFGVSHLVVFTATKVGTYMKFAKLPHGPTLTFRIASFSVAREVRASQKRVHAGARDFTSAPLQVLNGFGSSSSASAGVGNSADALKLASGMLRDLFPAIDVPTFNPSECRRVALFHREKGEDSVHFRHFSVGRRVSGVQRGVARLLRASRLPKLGKKAEIADYILGGGGASESEMEDLEEVPSTAGKSGKTAIRLSEMGPRIELQLVKAEEGIFSGVVLYHRYQTRTPGEKELLEQKARLKNKLKKRNKMLEARVESNKKKKQKVQREDIDAEPDTFGDNLSDSDGDKPRTSATKKKHSFARRNKKNAETEQEWHGEGKGKGKGKGKWLGKGKVKGKDKGTKTRDNPRDRTMERFKSKSR